MKFWSRVAIILVALASMAACDHVRHIDEMMQKQSEHVCDK